VTFWKRCGCDVRVYVQRVLMLVRSSVQCTIRASGSREQPNTAAVILLTSGRLDAYRSHTHHQKVAAVRLVICAVSVMSIYIAHCRTVPLMCSVSEYQLHFIESVA